MNQLLRPALLLFAFAATSVFATPAALPADSIYQLESTFSDQYGKQFQLAERRGKPQLVAMFYTSCKYVCPLIIDSVKGVEHALTESERSGLAILLVSMDPARDDTAALRSVFDKRKLNPTRWTLARADVAAIRKFAAVLGVRYRALIDGEFNHTSALFLLDAEGRKLASSARLGAIPDAAFLAAVRAALAPPGRELKKPATH
ncbi:MAG: SCO family protein [Pseudomonadota bacterium]|nr:SCO family protein [Pseudomonadota bacterium]